MGGRKSWKSTGEWLRAEATRRKLQGLVVPDSVLAGKGAWVETRAFGRRWKKSEREGLQ